MSEILKIGAVAKRTGLSVDAIRFYEKEGLLKVSRRSEGGFRLFQDKDIEDLHLIRNGQSRGFSLEEIRDLLSVRDGTSTPCADVKKLLERKLVTLQLKIAEFRSRKSEANASCPVLDSKRSSAPRKDES